MNPGRFGLLFILSLPVAACSLFQPNVPVTHSFSGAPFSGALTARDWVLAERTAQNALQFNTDQTSSWSNPETGNGGTVRAAARFASKERRECRVFLMTVRIADPDGKNPNGNTHQVKGTACRMENGAWILIPPSES